MSSPIHLPSLHRPARGSVAKMLPSAGLAAVALTSSFGGDFLLFLNDGAGTFTFEREFPAVASASCALAMDLDNDRDLDLAFVDETADILETWKNGGTTRLGDLDGDGVVSFADVLRVLAEWGDCDSCPEDLDGNGRVEFADVLIVLGNWG